MSARGVAWHVKLQETKMIPNDKYAQELEGLWFPIKIGDEEEVAFISSKALNDHFDMGKKCVSQGAAYRRHRKIIDSTARRKFLCNPAQPILLRSSDF